MTDRPKDHMDDESIASGIGKLPGVEADPAFRDRLRSAFVSGELDAKGAPEPGRPSQRSGLRWWHWLVPATAVAVAAALFVLNPGPPLRVASMPEEGYVRIAGAPIQLIDTGKLNDALVPGASVALPPDETLDLVADGTVLYEVVGGTRMTLPATPGRWFSRAPTCSLFAGEIRMKTGAQFAGASLRVYTPDGMVVVTGTLLSIQSDAGGTCVCVLEGTAEVGINEADLQPVPPGNRKIMLKDGTVEIIPVKPMHRDGVLDFDQRVGDRMQSEGH
jgi:hypothetical protein